MFHQERAGEWRAETLSMLISPESHPAFYPTFSKYMWKDPDLLMFTKVNQCLNRLFGQCYDIEFEVCFHFTIFFSRPCQDNIHRFDGQL